ncbi:MAG: hypothetical protein HY791_13580 [Deltaproteobacteria bacterium]|nr:hypothetical protein [Deltaproteobacteria bacterium]
MHGAARIADGEVKEEAKSLLVKKPHVLGRDAILEQPFDGQPTKTARSWRPLCHASTNKRWHEYLEQVRAFRALYAAASAAFRAGKMSVAFPPWSFRPSTSVRQGLIAT